MNWMFCWVPMSFDLQRIQTFSYKTQKDEALLQNKIKETGLPFYQSRFAKLRLAVLMSTVCGLRDNIILQSHLGICFLRGFPWCFNQSEVFIHKPMPHLFSVLSFMHLFWRWKCSLHMLRRGLFSLQVTVASIKRQLNIQACRPIVY